MANQPGLNELALFAGAGGGILGGHLLGWRTVCAVEWEPYPASVLCARQNEGILPPFPVWDDVRTFCGTPWRGIVDVISGGFPCQDISAAGRGAGIDGERSGMWREMARIVGEVRPRFVFVENSPMLTSRGLGRVLGDLAALGYDAEWDVLGGADVGNESDGERIWILAKAAGVRWEEVLPAYSGRSRKAQEIRPATDDGPRGWADRIYALEQVAGQPGILGGGDVLAAGVDRLKAIGNGQMANLAAFAVASLAGRNIPSVAMC